MLPSRRNVFVAIGALIAVLVVWNELRRGRMYGELAETIASDSVSDVEYICIGDERQPCGLKLTDPDDVLRFLRDAEDIEEYFWSNPGSDVEIVFIEIAPLNIFMRSHAPHESEYLHGYLGRGNQENWTNYGQFRSKNLRSWAITANP